MVYCAQLISKTFRERRDRTLVEEVKISNPGFSEYEPSEAAMRKKESYENEMLTIKQSDQFDWHERLIHTVELPEQTPSDILVKYDEVYRISKEFAATASYFGRVVIREYFLPLDEKTVKPISSVVSDSGFMRHKYEICNIRFKFATDEHGIFNGNDEMVCYSYLYI